MKLEVGDKVRILDGAHIKNYAGSWNSTLMASYVGNVATVTGVDYFRDAYTLDCDKRFVWDERGLELVEEAGQTSDDSTSMR